MLLYFIRALFVIVIAAFLFVSIFIAPGGVGSDQTTEQQGQGTTTNTFIIVQPTGSGQEPTDPEAADNPSLISPDQIKVLEKIVNTKTTPPMARMPEPGESAELSMVVVRVTFSMIIAFAAIAMEWLTPKNSIKAVAGIFFGLIVGVLMSWILSPLMEMVNNIYFHMEAEPLRFSKWILGACLCYISISMVLQTKDDVRFIIPYVEFSRQTKGLRPMVLDTSVIIDGRIADIAETRLFDAPLVVPRFVLNELQLIADAGDKMKRQRGRRGLDILHKMQTSTIVDIIIDDTPPPGVETNTPVDHKLVAFSKNCDGRLVTNDFNLNKVAQLRGVDVINVNDIANATKTVTLPGEDMQVKIIRPGDSAQQGVGYLEDGTMVVVEDARDKVGKTIQIAITSSLQTSAGRMVFGKFEKYAPATRNDVPSRPKKA